MPPAAEFPAVPDAPATLPFRPPAVMPGERVVGLLPGATADRRTAVVAKTGLCGAASVQLRTESFSAAVGWFPQGGVELAADQLPGLRDLLGAALAQLDPPKTARRPAAHDPAAIGPATVPFRAAG